ncbi:MAG: Fic family protein [Flavobacteriaceae bacterium]|nr:Fic family protein [Flavobacteriaceae bacterium]MCY4268176.1 Fic family protein [Flavobacteriaceae bacterium]MCY4299947.1 Fic family protein [Flavobacteriaceae bacterium]
MLYNWELDDWLDFKYDLSSITPLIYQFMESTGRVSRMVEGFSKRDKIETIIDMMVNEAMKTSEIEDEHLHEDSVRKSVMKNLGFEVDEKSIRDVRAIGMVEVMNQVRKDFNKRLTKQTLFNWHQAVMKGKEGEMKVGFWRKSKIPVQIISGPEYKRVVHFEAPPSVNVPKEMGRFIKWYNDSRKTMAIPLVRSAMAHLYFESIHPFQDGNGRIGRALSEKAISQDMGYPVLLNLSKTIQENRKQYYDYLKRAQRTNEITEWMHYFIKTIHLSQMETKHSIEFTLKKTKFFDLWKNQLNDRQTKVINRIFKEGPKGFKGGMNIRKYMGITKTSRAAAKRDLQDLNRKGILMMQRGGRSTHYLLQLEQL